MRWLSAAHVFSLVATLSCVVAHNTVHAQEPGRPDGESHRHSRQVGNDHRAHSEPGSEPLYERHEGHPHNKHDSLPYDKNQRPPGGNFRGGVGIGPVFLDPGFAAPPPPQSLSRASYSVFNVPPGEAFPANFVAGNTHASAFIERADVAFREREYDAALRWLQHAQIEQPENSWLTLFESEVLFAIGDYNAAADAAIRALARLQPVPWPTIANNQREWYAQGELGVLMGRLNAFIRQHGGTPKTLFLRGYHAAFLGDRTAAIADLRQVSVLVPEHAQAASLLSFLGSELKAVPVKSEPMIELLPPANHE